MGQSMAILLYDENKRKNHLGGKQYYCFDILAYNINFQMGQEITVDANDEFNISDQSMIYQTSFRQQVQNLVKISNSLTKKLKNASSDSNQLLSQYKDGFPLAIGREILYDTDKKEIALHQEKKYLEILLHYFKNREAQYLLNLIKNGTKALSKHINEHSSVINYKYFNGVDGDIVLFKYYITNKTVKLTNSDEIKMLHLYCYSIEVFKLQTVPLEYQISLKLLINKQAPLIDKIKLIKQNGQMIQVDFSSIPQPDLQEVKNKLFSNHLLIAR